MIGDSLQSWDRTSDALNEIAVNRNAIAVDNDAVVWLGVDSNAVIGDLQAAFNVEIKRDLILNIASGVGVEAAANGNINGLVARDQRQLAGPRSGMTTVLLPASSHCDPLKA